MDKNLLQDMLARARKAYTINDLESAEALAGQIVAQVPRAVHPRIFLGTILSTRGKYAEAETAFKKALAEDPVNIEALNNLGVLFRLQGRLDEAVHVFKKALNQTSERADINYNLGNVYKQQGNVEQAKAQYRQAIERNSAFVLAYNNLGTLLEAELNHQEAANIFAQGLESDPNHPTLRYNLGLAQQHLGELAQAEENFQRAIKAKPGWIDALNNLGIVLQAQERYDESIKIFEEIIDLDPKNSTAHNNIATTLAKQGKMDEAIGYYKKALEQNPSYEKAAVNLGQVFEKVEGGDSIISDLSVLVSKNPANLDLRLQLARACIKAERFAEAEKHAGLILELSPDHKGALKCMGLLCQAQGRSKDAEVWFTRLHTVDPSDLSYRLDQARALRDNNRVSDAIEKVKDYLKEKDKDLDAIDLFSDLLLDSGKIQTAIDFLEPLQNEFPDEARLVSSLSRAYQKIGRKDDALRAADELISIQGRRANPDDIDALNESLELYEQAVAAFNDEHGEAWEKSLARLGGLRLGRSADLQDVQVLSNEATEQIEEASIPILEFSSFEYEFTDEDVIDVMNFGAAESESTEEAEEKRFERVLQEVDENSPSLLSMIPEPERELQMERPLPTPKPVPKAEKPPVVPPPEEELESYYEDSPEEAYDDLESLPDPLPDPVPLVDNLDDFDLEEFQIDQELDLALDSEEDLIDAEEDGIDDLIEDNEFNDLDDNLPEPEPEPEPEPDFTEELSLEGDINELVEPDLSENLDLNVEEPELELVIQVDESILSLDDEAISLDEDVFAEFVQDDEDYVIDGVLETEHFESNLEDSSYERGENDENTNCEEESVTSNALIDEIVLEEVQSESQESAQQQLNEGVASLFDYLQQLSSTVPNEIASQLSNAGIPERLTRIRDYLLQRVDSSAFPQRAPGSTFVDRALDRANKDGTNFPVRWPAKKQGFSTKIQELANPNKSEEIERPSVVRDPQSELLLNAFGMIGRLSQILPPEQMLPVKEKMRHLLSVMESIRSQ